MTGAITVAASVVAQGLGDCEAVREGVLAQPASALSSLAFVAAGLWIIARGGTPRRAVTAFGIAVSLEGLGSLAYHGPGGLLAKLAHDLGLIAPSAVLIGVAAGALARSHAPVLWVAGGLTAISGAVLVGVQTSTNLLVGMGFLAAAAACAFLLRTPHSHVTRPEARLLLTGGVVSVLALAANILGRTGGPVCSPASIFQLHAVWHALAAVALTLLARFVFHAPDENLR